MLDNPDKTARLLSELKAAVPFKVELTPWVLSNLRAQHPDLTDATEQIVSDLSYAGDAGGIVLRLAGTSSSKVLVISLTHVLVPRSLPFALSVRQYQKHRIKKLKQQEYI